MTTLALVNAEWGSQPLGIGLRHLWASSPTGCLTGGCCRRWRGGWGTRNAGCTPSWSPRLGGSSARAGRCRGVNLFRGIFAAKCSPGSASPWSDPADNLSRRSQRLRQSRCQTWETALKRCYIFLRVRLLRCGARKTHLCRSGSAHYDSSADQRQSSTPEVGGSSHDVRDLTVARGRCGEPAPKDPGWCQS